MCVGVIRGIEVMKGYWLSMDGMECERSKLQRFCSKNISLRRYGSSIGLVVLHQSSIADECRKITKTNYAIN